jgi:hypothetical protein
MRGFAEADRAWRYAQITALAALLTTGCSLLPPAPPGALAHDAYQCHHKEQLAYVGAARYLAGAGTAPDRTSAVPTIRA